MRGRREERIETAIDHGAAALLGAAVFWAAFSLLVDTLDKPWLWAVATGCAFGAYVLAAGALRRIAPSVPKFEIRAFRISDLDEPGELLLTEQVELLLTEQVELVLTDADRLDTRQPGPLDELVLDDILAELGPGSRVVRLFDPTAMPTPGQIDARIQQHLRESPSPAAPPDAAQALHDALARLRSTLR